MLVYAFYGCGKTTLCKDDPNFYDLDFADFYNETMTEYYGKNISVIENAYIEKARSFEKDYPVVLINRYVPNTADLAIMQDSYQNCIKRIVKRHQGNFMPDKFEYNSVLAQFKEEGTDILFLSNEKYLSDLSKQIIEFYQESPIMEMDL